MQADSQQEALCFDTAAQPSLIPGAATCVEDGAAELKLNRYDWPDRLSAVDRQGWAVLPELLKHEQCAQLREYYVQAERFRSRVVMQQHAFGQGEYQYFAYPLPHEVQQLRSALYAKLLPLAQRWRELLEEGAPPWPASHADLLAQCHAAGQQRPTPLLLRYGAGDYNRLHQDLYGALQFPLQVVVLLSTPGQDFDGGELVLTEQRARMQSRVQVIPLRQGDAAIIAVNQRPVAGLRGRSRAQHRHGVSAVRSGERYTLGLIFHDAT